MFATGQTSSYMAPNDSREWAGVFVTVSLSWLQPKFEYHLLHAATHQRPRGQTGFHCESTDFSFIS